MNEFTLLLLKLLTFGFKVHKHCWLAQSNICNLDNNNDCENVSILIYFIHLQIQFYYYILWHWGAFPCSQSQNMTLLFNDLSPLSKAYIQFLCNEKENQCYNLLGVKYYLHLYRYILYTQNITLSNFTVVTRLLHKFRW